MIHLALIGVGKWGTNYLKSVELIRDCRIVATYTRNYRQILKNSNIDGVIIATPSETHYEVTRFFLEKNYNLLIEKPLVTSYRHAKELESMYLKSTSVVHVGHNYLFHPEFMKLSNEKLKYLHFHIGGYGPFRESTALWDWGPHAVSMCLTLMGKEPERVTAWGNRMSKDADIIYAKLDYKEDFSAFITTGRMMPEKTRNISLVSTKKRMSVLLKDVNVLERQLQYFIDAVRKKQRNDKNFFLGVRVVKILHHLEQSLIHNGRTIEVTS